MEESKLKVNPYIDSVEEIDGCAKYEREKSHGFISIYDHIDYEQDELYWDMSEETKDFIEDSLTVSRNHGVPINNLVDSFAYDQEMADIIRDELPQALTYTVYMGLKDDYLVPDNIPAESICDGVFNVVAKTSGDMSFKDVEKKVDNFMRTEIGAVTADPLQEIEKQKPARKNKEKER